MRLIDRLGQLLGIGDSATQLRVASLTIIQTALRAEAADEHVDRLVSGRSRTSDSK